MRLRLQQFFTHKPPLLFLMVAVYLLVGGAAPALALQPDEIVLVVNKNVPASVNLAKYYAKLRGVPERQIMPLDLPGGEIMPFEQYESEVVPAAREFLRTNNL